MTRTPDDNEHLDNFFRAARSRPETPDVNLLTRVLEAAEAEQTAKAQDKSAVRPQPATQSVSSNSNGFFGAIASTLRGHVPIRALGGWPVAAGFAAVACTGVWIGTLPQNPISQSGIFVVSDASISLEGWGDVTGFGLAEAAGTEDLQ